MFLPSTKGWGRIGGPKNKWTTCHIQGWIRYQIQGWTKGEPHISTPGRQRPSAQPSSVYINYKREIIPRYHQWSWKNPRQTYHPPPPQRAYWRIPRVPKCTTNTKNGRHHKLVEERMKITKIINEQLKEDKRRGFNLFSPSLEDYPFYLQHNKSKRRILTPSPGISRHQWHRHRQWNSPMQSKQQYAEQEEKVTLLRRFPRI